MPIAYSYDLYIVVMHMDGKYDTDDLRAAILQALDDPQCPKNPVLLFDMRASQALSDRSTSDVRQMAYFLAKHGSRFGRRLAMVVSNDLGYGLMRLGGTHAELGGLDADVFRDIAEARSWLLR